MSAPPAAAVRLTDPADLIGSVPHLLGFHPELSLVVLALDRSRVSATLRVDLPPDADAPALAEQIVGPVLAQRPTGAVLLVVGGRPGPEGEPPQCALVDAVDDALAAHGVPVVHAAWASATTAGARWRCYDDAGCGGTVPDPDRSPVAAATVAAGLVTFASRAELAALIAPDDPAALARRAGLLAAADAEHPLDPRVAAARWRTITALHDRAGSAAPLALPDGAVVEVASALCDARVRDACLGLALRPGGAVAAERLWLALTRATPAPERAEPAALLGFTAYLRGDGALAGLALDAALDACPDHALAALLGAALHGGVRPERLRSLGEDAARAAAAGLPARS